MQVIQEDSIRVQRDYLYRDTLEAEMKQNKPKARVSFSGTKVIHLVEHRSELSSDEKSNTWYNSEECQAMAKKAGIDVLLQSKVDAKIQNRDESNQSSQALKREETRGLEQFLSLVHYKTFKNARKERIKAVLEAQRALRLYGVKDHSWVIHVACARESLSSTVKAASLGLSDQAAAFEIYREG